MFWAPSQAEQLATQDQAYVSLSPHIHLSIRIYYGHKWVDTTKAQGQTTNQNLFFKFFGLNPKIVLVVFMFIKILLEF